jgi:hypothetical protein
MEEQYGKNLEDLLVRFHLESMDRMPQGIDWVRPLLRRALGKQIGPGFQCRNAIEARDLPGSSALEEDRRSPAEDIRL